ncbi:Holliday junction DNA helicase subunit RuvA [Belliella buryatensis]|uniref:Holliday junction branch migration complex subunit RuvA n=1 Tax=Belliella buryatensis TaxID=1500549 RepID=A0A239G1E4_9BACT|nr:Holliday junction branch migration protein RuvA [Belliella buryatensis]SNS61864.1 Holliday junction DNA helicase subunit RuvA [Belliella buryatensis]
MIAYLKGRLVFKDPTYVIIDINGVGYLVKISLQTYSKIKDEEQVMLLTFLHIKEDAHTIYGFKEEAEKKLFLNLISISGVGPNTGLMILSSLSSEELESAIIQEDFKTIQNVKGVGAKTAQRIVLELKDKVKKDSILDLSTSQTGFMTQNNKIKEEALQALITLGFPKATAEKNIATILKKTGSEISLEDLIKASLKST